MNTFRRVLSIDIGFSACKCVYMGLEWKFPSHIAPTKQNTVDLGDKPTGYLWEGTRYLVGEPWNKSANADKYSKDISYLIDYSPLFVAHAINKINEIPEILALGLPLEQFRSERGKLRKKLSKFEVNGTEYNIELRVYAQSVGALANYIHMHSPPQNEDGFVVDVGFNTALVLRYQSLQAKSDGSNQYSQFGIMKALEPLGACLKKDFGESYTLLELNDISKQGFIKRYGKVIDVRECVENAMTNHIETMCMTIESEFGLQLSRVDRLILAGGGAYSIAPKLPDKYREFTLILEKPEYANSYGYWLLAGGRNEN